MFTGALTHFIFDIRKSEEIIILGIKAISGIAFMGPQNVLLLCEVKVFAVVLL